MVYGKIIACVTGAKSSLEVVKVALCLSNPRTKLILLHIESHLDPAVMKKISAQLSEAKKLCEGMLSWEPRILESKDIKKAILSFAGKENPDAIIVGVLPRSRIGHAFHPGISDYLMAKSKCTVISVNVK